MKNNYAFDFSQESILKPKASSFLRWAGGKRRLLNKLLPLLPKNARNYYEPFIGGGALFFAISPNSKNSIISDANEELMNCYKQVSSHPDKIIEILSKYKFNKRLYYKIRDSNPKDDLERATRFIYLNKTCWNGLYRVNQKGEFNVPIGKFKTEPTICPEQKIINASKILNNTKILSGDFETVVEDSEKSDFIYFDPPYTVKHDNNGFRQYNEKVFSWEDQERLATISHILSKRGVNIMISNANTTDIKALYENFYKYEVSRTSSIGGNISSRGKVKELIITSYKIQNINKFSDIIEVE